MGRGSLRIYLGAAPGVGKTVAMLDEAHRRLERGTDVVVGYVETHGRPHTAALLDGLEVLRRRQVTYRGATLTELDVPRSCSSTSSPTPTCPRPPGSATDPPEARRARPAAGSDTRSDGRTSSRSSRPASTSSRR